MAPVLTCKKATIPRAEAIGCNTLFGGFWRAAITLLGLISRKQESISFCYRSAKRIDELPHIALK
jgi:hypothetical protein